MRKPVFGVSDQLRHKPDCKATEDGWRLEISDLGNRGLYYLCSENKGADQLRGSAPLFLNILKTGFLMTQLIFLLPFIYKGSNAMTSS